MGSPMFLQQLHPLSSRHTPDKVQMRGEIILTDTQVWYFLNFQLCLICGIIIFHEHYSTNKLLTKEEISPQRIGFINLFSPQFLLAARQKLSQEAKDLAN